MNESKLMSGDPHSGTSTVAEAGVRGREGGMAGRVDRCGPDQGRRSRSRPTPRGDDGVSSREWPEASLGMSCSGRGAEGHEGFAAERDKEERKADESGLRDLNRRHSVDVPVPGREAWHGMAWRWMACMRASWGKRLAR